MEKSKEQFYVELEKVYQIFEDLKTPLKEYYDFSNKEKVQVIELFLKENNLKISDESRLAVAHKIISLKNDSFVTFLKKEGFNETDINNLIIKITLFAKEIYKQLFSNLFKKIEEEKLLTEFYRKIISGVTEIGEEMNNLHLKWKEHIIFNINPSLYEEFCNDDNVIKFLEENNLFDLGHNNEISDRSYSVLVKTNDKYEVKTYSQAFPIHINNIASRINKLINNLENLEDNVFELKTEFIEYFNSINDALNETDRNRLVQRWFEVDSKWMKITSPIQVCHPLEYYDDHYRKAVGMDWDLRITNPKFANNQRVNNIKSMYESLFKEFDQYDNIYTLSSRNLDRIQLYIGKPILYYGSHLDGLFSAQVVPNDMVASEMFGKKIFAFPDLVLDSKRSAPLMKLPKIVFEEEFVKQERKFVYNETEKWLQLYDIETIGHEFGHILWLDEDTEIKMNKSGNFKNIEEFKATTGGIVSFLLNPENNLEFDLVRSVVRRAIGLIGWMEVGEVQPYYCEALIHLKGLFDSEIIKFENDKLKVSINDETYQNFKQWYLITYKDLARTYLEKKDAKEFLSKYAIKEKKIFLPIEEEIKQFVLWYYDKYKEYANTIDDNDSKENYINI